MAYSLDLREKIARAYDQGLGSQRAIAELFGVSRSFVEKLLARRRSTGQLAPLPHGGGRRPACSGDGVELVRQCVAAQPDLTLDELCQRLAAEHGTRLSPSAMSRLLTRLDLPRKKSRSTTRSATPSG